MASVQERAPAGEYIRECENPPAAMQGASDEAAYTTGRVLPAIMFMQGGRPNLALAMTFADVEGLVRRRSAPRDSDPRLSTNRPLMADHARTIENYLVDNADGYIMPSLTLTVDSDLSVYTVKSPSPVKSAWVVLRNDTKFWVTDGQHRLAALTGASELRGNLIGAINRRPDLLGDGVAVHLVFERDVDRIHQDFADAAQTKQIPPSMLAAYNQRAPFNRVLARIVRDCPLLEDRVDAMSKTLGKKSQKLFLLNQVRGFLKELTLGDYAATEETVARAAGEQLATPKQEGEAAVRAVWLLDLLSEKMKPWTEVVELTVGTPASNKVAILREKYLNMTATGLVIIGRIGYLVFTNVPGDTAQQAHYFEELAKLDWEKNKWEGTVILEGSTRILTARSAVNLAVKKARQGIGIPRDW